MIGFESKHFRCLGVFTYKFQIVALKCSITIRVEMEQQFSHPRKNVVGIVVIIIISIVPLHDYLKNDY